MRKLYFKEWSSEKISQRIFYFIVGLGGVVFGLFFLIGYDMPFEENPDFVAPLFTDVLLSLMCLLLLVSVLLVIWAIVHTARSSQQDDEVSHGIRERRISQVTWGVTGALLLITFVLGSSSPILVNGQNYQDWLWLKVSDMLVYSAIIMMIIAVVSVLFGATRYIRKGRTHDR